MWNYVFNIAKSFKTVAKVRSYFPRSKFICQRFEKLSCCFPTYSYALLPPPIHLSLGPRWIYVCACARPCVCVLNTQFGRPNMGYNGYNVPDSMYCVPIKVTSLPKRKCGISVFWSNKKWQHSQWDFSVVTKSIHINIYTII